MNDLAPTTAHRRHPPSRGTRPPSPVAPTLPLDDGVPGGDLPGGDSPAVDARTPVSRKDGRPEGRRSEANVVADSTAAAYRARGVSLLRRYCIENGLEPETDVDPNEFALFVLSLRKAVKPATWRTYKQAALTALQGMSGDAIEDAVAILDYSPAPEDVGARPLGAAEPLKLTSAMKAKSVTFGNFERIRAAVLGGRVAPTAFHLRDWLVAGIATGLRPTEWRAAEIVRRRVAEEDRVLLVVRSAKATSGRGNGAVRTLDLTSFRATTLAVVERMAKNGKAWEDEGLFDRRQDQCAKMLYRINARLFPNKDTVVALYTLRHQFATNMRSSVGTKQESLAAMMGHAIDATSDGYGMKRSKGWAPEHILDVPAAVESEVATVRKVIDRAAARERLAKVMAGREVAAVPSE